MGEVLSETKDELKLKYDISVTQYPIDENGIRRVSIVFTLADEGRLKPLEQVQLVIPSRQKNRDGSHQMDLVVSIDMSKTDDGKRIGRIELLRDLAERAEIELNTHTLDGKLDRFTRLHHVIQIAPYLEKAG